MANARSGWEGGRDLNGGRSGAAARKGGESALFCAQVVGKCVKMACIGQ